MTKFSYVPLDDPNTQIRLLELLLYPAGEDVLSCGLSMWSLADAPTYLAISYTWGSPADACTIKVNGKDMRVRKNCFSALTEIGSHGKCRYYWMDAICIDQDNLDQKAAQVAIMAEIFEQASGVMAYLGPPTIESASLMHFLNGLSKNRLSQAPFKITDDKESVLVWTTYISTKLAHMEDHIFELIVSCLIHFSRIPWFSRLWVAQEIYVAKQVTLCFGNLLVDMVELYYLLASKPFTLIPMIHKHGIRTQTELDQARGMTGALGVDMLQNNLDGLNKGLEWGNHVLSDDLYRLKKLVQLTYRADKTPQRVGVADTYDPLLFPYIGTNYAIGPNERDTTRDGGLDAVQSLINGLQCQDPRDMIFGTLRFIDWSTFPVIRPDYNILSFDLARKVLDSFCIGRPKHETSFRLAEDLVRNMSLDLHDSDVVGRSEKHQAESLTMGVDNKTEARRGYAFLTECRCHSARLIQTSSGVLSALLQRELQPSKDLIHKAWKQLEWKQLMDRSQALFVFGDLYGILCHDARPGDYLVQLHGEVDPRAALVVREQGSSLHEIVGLAFLAPGVRICVGLYECECFKTFEVKFEDEELLLVAACFSKVAGACTDNGFIDVASMGQLVNYTIYRSYASLESIKDSAPKAEARHERKLFEQLKKPERRFIENSFMKTMMGQMFEDLLTGKRAIPGMLDSLADLVIPMQMLTSHYSDSEEEDKTDKDFLDFNVGPGSRFAKRVERRKKRFVDSWKGVNKP